MKRFFFPIITLLLFVSCQKEVYYNISTTVNPKDAGSVSVSPAGPSVLEGTSVTVTAQPNGEYVFTGWSGSLSGADNPKTVTVTADLNITANFALKEYPLSLSVEGEGAVSEKVISTKTDYTSGTVVELTAKAADHWLFDHWEGDLNGNTNPVQIAVSSAKTVKAVFVKKMYDLTIEVQGEGAVQETVVNTKSSSYQEGTVVEVTALPGEHWVFDHWEGDLSGNKNPAQITIASAKKVKAVFVEKMYPLTVEIKGNGAVKEEVITTKSGSYQDGSVVELTATPGSHWVFDHWEGDLEGGQNPAQITISSVLSVRAVFVEKMYPLTVDIQGGGAVNEEVIDTKSSSYQEGSVVQLTATPNTYWAFDHWEGDVTGTENPALITISGAAAVKAVFVEQDPGIIFTDTEYISPYEINRRMGMGINVACQLDAYREDGVHNYVDETAWGNPPCTQALFDKMAAAGFKSVRIPVTWMGTFGPDPDYIIDAERLNRVAEVVGYAEKAGMYAIINMHHDDAGPHQEGHPHPSDFWIDPGRAAADPDYNNAVKAQLSAMWKQIARKFRDKGDFLMFESFNEPGSGFFWSWATDAEKDAHQGEYDCLSEWNQVFVDAVRSTGGNNATRWLVAVGAAAKERNLDRLILPQDYVSNNRLMLAIHFYEPEAYVFGAIDEWGHTAMVPDEEIWRFDEAFIASEFSRYRVDYLDKGIPLCVDEIGCFNRGNEREKAFQLYYLEYLVRAASLNGFATFIWDDGGTEDRWRGEYLFWHGTGDYFGYAEELIGIINKATYSTDPDYTLESIYNRAPFATGDEMVIIEIPDSEFKKYLIGRYDRDGDGEIRMFETKHIIEIDVNTQNISSMKGIEHFPNLVRLVCRGREDWVADEYGPGLLTELDVSHNPHLKWLEFNNNHITAIDLSNNVELESICCRSNAMTAIDLSHNSKLTGFDASINQIGAIDFSNNPLLDAIYLRGNLLTYLDVSHLSQLKTLNFGGNQIANIDLTNNYLLESLECDGNLLTSLDLSYNKHLSFLRCQGNPYLRTILLDQGYSISRVEKDDFAKFVYQQGIEIKDPAFRKYILNHFDIDGDNEISPEEAQAVTKMDVCTDQIYSLNGIESFVNLEILFCEGSYSEEYTDKEYYGVLKELDISQNIKLTQLKCGYNQLTVLDLSHNPKLISVSCQNNELTSLNTSENPLLEEIICRNCYISSLDVSSNTALRDFDCQGSNRISRIDLSHCPNLSLLNANGIGLEELDVSNNVRLSWLGCSNSSFPSIDLSANPHLHCFYGDCNLLSELDLTQNTELEYLYIREAPHLQSVYLKAGHSVAHIFKDEHTQIVYR